MKITALINCNGIGYENFNEGETRDIKKEIAETLINFGYAEEVKKGKKEVV
jgi:hypothetical protein